MTEVKLSDRETEEPELPERPEEPHSTDSRSSSSSASSAPSCRWVKPRTLGSRFDSDVWDTDLFEVSDKVFEDNHRKVRCVICVSNEWSTGKVMNGTYSVAYHAEHGHSKDLKVIAWLGRSASAKAAELQSKKDENSKIKKVGCFFPFFILVLVYLVLFVVFCHCLIVGDATKSIGRFCEICV